MTRIRRVAANPTVLTGLVAGVVVLALLVAYAVKPRAYVTGGNGVRPLSLIATIPQGDRLCASDVEIPAGTAGIRFTMAPGQGPASARVTLERAGQVTRESTVDVAAFAPVTARFAPLAEASTTSVCVTARGGDVAVAGADQIQNTNDRALRLEGERLEARLSMLFLPAEGARRSLASQWPEVMERAALFRPGFIAPAVLWLVLLVLLPAALIASVVGVTVGLEGRRAVMLLSAVAFVSAGSWAVTTLPFDSPDESEHFAYVQSVAERQTRPDSTLTAQGPYSTGQVYALEALRHPTRVGGPDQRPPWNEAARQRYDRIAGQGRVDNGGGYTDATRLHLPAYYSLLLPGYFAGGDDIFAQLTFARLLSALLAIVVALCAFGIVREMLPGRPELALVAGLLVALHPMFSFIAGSVNNDMGVNAGAALVTYFGIRALRRPSIWVLAAFGVALAVTPVMKATGLALYPPALLVVAGYVWRHRQLVPAARAVATIGAAFLLVNVALRALLSAAVADGAPGSADGEGAVGAGILGSLGGKASYTWQLVFPKLPFMQEHYLMAWPFYDIYIVRGWGAFGWYSFLFPKIVFIMILAGLALLLGVGVLALWQARARFSAWGWEVAFLLAIPITVVVAISFAYYTPTPRSIPGEQGRYLFTAAAPLAALAAGALLGLPARWQRPAAVALIVGVAGLSYAGRLTYLTGVFT